MDNTRVKSAIRDANISTPYYLIDIPRLRANLEILADVRRRSGAKILLAQKAYSIYDTYPLIAEYLDGTTASGLYEARLGKEEFGGETHVFSPAFIESEFDELLTYVDDIVFNSPSQVKKYGERARRAGKSIGLRINPEFSTQEGHDIYDPCAVGSRLGTTLANFDESILPMLDGLHMHTLCEQNSDDLVATFKVFEEKFGRYLHGMRWLNLGGGHHITRADYDIEALVDLVRYIRATYGVEVYLEPGEGVVLNAGYLVSRVVETMHNGMDIALLDTSAACHMPDVIEMPYRPPVMDSDMPNIGMHTYRFGGPTCLAGDIIGDYSFDRELHIGDTIIFEDMALYTMVKTNTFNGMPLPKIARLNEDNTIDIIRVFDYSDFKMRLGK